jgi:hypothetical protein
MRLGVLLIGHEVGMMNRPRGFELETRDERHLADRLLLYYESRPRQ